jgi:hypothetical protein
MIYSTVSTNAPHTIMERLIIAANTERYMKSAFRNCTIVW